ncbi:methyltransferase family protein [Gilvimarinus xylanilyticus]|uniref:Isoprenylcysteine carboxylmethyltransferase family protein n=1 Tax=Gilvimarinus xylanilyticus TaxID=2944139 RepID=A0A9X2HW71_9GAMM|nr:isoprenylcysteine carboxylmethyltransferase family protein [Gilvimarinus xylanilyticus]MCP8899290.1 isoprenylcysteine carboxylmethyltransferase family protein [Gilvimarinus xylanilyticus]
MATPLLLFGLLSLPLIGLCWRQLSNPRCHGFYRFFAFETLLALALLNLHPQNIQLFTPLGIAAGFCMSGSLAMVLVGLKQLQQGGRDERQKPENFAFENTRILVTWGIYRYIRHPMYSSLLLLGVGIFLQGVGLVSSALLLVLVIFVGLTVRVEEAENLAFFGDSYRDYKRRSKILIPGVL